MLLVRVQQVPRRHVDAETFPVCLSTVLGRAAEPAYYQLVRTSSTCTYM
jgi:hypothetical protein